MSCSIRTRSTADSYSQKLSTFLASAWDSYNPMKQRLSVWAKNTASAFVSTVRTATPLTTVINDITMYANEQQTQAQQLTQQQLTQQQAPRKVVTTPRRSSTTTVREDLTDSLVNQYYRTFAYEYTTWYDAFLEEAVEDPTGPSASERWSTYVVKKLVRKSTYNSSQLTSAAAAWLLLHRR